MKKVVAWYNLLIAAGVTQFETEEKTDETDSNDSKNDSKEE